MVHLGLFRPMDGLHPKPALSSSLHAHSAQTHYAVATPGLVNPALATVRCVRQHTGGAIRVINLKTGSAARPVVMFVATVHTVAGLYFTCCFWRLIFVLLVLYLH